MILSFGALGLVVAVDFLLWVYFAVGNGQPAFGSRRWKIFNFPL
jgi:hypothetical protein